VELARQSQFALFSALAFKGYLLSAAWKSVIRLFYFFLDRLPFLDEFFFKHFPPNSSCPKVDFILGHL